MEARHILLYHMGEKMVSPGGNRSFGVAMEKDTLRLYVGRLPYRTTDQDLSDLFGQYGEVLSATVIIDRETGRSKGFGFVEMSNDQEAQSAMNQLNNSTLEGRTIIVNEAQAREPRSGGGGNFQRRDRRSGGDRGGYRDRDRGY
jgi:RNA recognition motif-containing protein